MMGDVDVQIEHDEVRQSFLDKLERSWDTERAMVWKHSVRASWLEYTAQPERHWHQDR
jgi:hypothetical protein